MQKENCVTLLRGPVMPNNGSSSSGHVALMCARVILYTTEMVCMCADWSHEDTTSEGLVFTTGTVLHTCGQKIERSI